MQISHELPLALLESAREWNDYDYCLPHLLDKYPAYKEHFLKAKADGRFIIMDNGLYEGVTHTEEDLIEKINLIEPDIFITPDAWNDSVETSANATRWMTEIKPKLPAKTNLMVVLQGVNFMDMYYAYNCAVASGFKHFAFNHSSVSYQKEFKHKNELVNAMMGRIDVISKFFNMGLFDKDDYIHLLGCSLPQEFGFYKDYPINSIDTSNPITFGFTRETYPDTGPLVKPLTKIDDIMAKPFDEDQECATIVNMSLFRDYCLQ
jgi:hypothetical protein